MLYLFLNSNFYHITLSTTGPSSGAAYENTGALSSPRAEYASPALPTGRRTVGNKTYELKDHLGNVRVTVSDKLTYSAGMHDATLTNFTHYYPFGMMQHNRSGIANTNYRFGFQGQEMDNEIKGPGNSINYKFRMHDPRVGRFFAIDPLTAKYPYYSPYQFSGNRVIDMVELEGLEPAKSKFLNGDYYYWDKKINTSSIEGNKYLEINLELSEYTQGREFRPYANYNGTASEYLIDDKGDKTLVRQHEVTVRHYASSGGGVENSELMKSNKIFDILSKNTATLGGVSMGLNSAYKLGTIDLINNGYWVGQTPLGSVKQYINPRISGKYGIKNTLVPGTFGVSDIAQLPTNSSLKLAKTGAKSLNFLNYAITGYSIHKTNVMYQSGQLDQVQMLNAQTYNVIGLTPYSMHVSLLKMMIGPVHENTYKFCKSWVDGMYLQPVRTINSLYRTNYTGSQMIDIFK